MLLELNLKKKILAKFGMTERGYFDNLRERVLRRNMLENELVSLQERLRLQNILDELGIRGDLHTAIMTYILSTVSDHGVRLELVDRILYRGYENFGWRPLSNEELRNYLLAVGNNLLESDGWRTIQRNRQEYESERMQREIALQEMDARLQRAIERDRRDRCRRYRHDGDQIHGPESSSGEELSSPRIGWYDHHDIPRVNGGRRRPAFALEDIDD